jgi:hypothetical protein
MVTKAAMHHQISLEELWIQQCLHLLLFETNPLQVLVQGSLKTSRSEENSIERLEFLVVHLNDFNPWALSEHFQT